MQIDDTISYPMMYLVFLYHPELTKILLFDKCPIFETHCICFYYLVLLLLSFYPIISNMVNFKCGKLLSQAFTCIQCSLIILLLCSVFIDNSAVVHIFAQNILSVKFSMSAQRELKISEGYFRRTCWKWSATGYCYLIVLWFVQAKIHEIQRSPF